MSERVGRLSRRRFIVSTGTIAAGAYAGTAFGVRVVSGRGTEDSKAAALDAFIRERMEAKHLPGLSLAIVRNGELLRTAAFGFANVAQKRLMRADTLINIASVTKTITCTAVMQLWEQGKFTLDDDVNKHLPFVVRNPAYPQVPITVRQLLSHVSSIADGPAYEASYACGDPAAPLGKWLRDNLTSGGASFDAKQNFHSWKPGAQYSYSNVAYGLLGHLVESLSGLSYFDYVMQNVFAPLGMSRSRFLLAGMDASAHATPYTYEKAESLEAAVGSKAIGEVPLRDSSWSSPSDTRGGVLVPHCLYSFATPPDGLARTSAVELVRLLRAYAAGGTLDGVRILKPETVAQILTDQHVHFAPEKRGGETDRQGLTWYGIKELGAGINWGHTGGDPGVSTIMAFRPEDRCGVVVLTNSTGHGLSKEIARRVLSG